MHPIFGGFDDELFEGREVRERVDARARFCRRDSTGV